MQMMKWEESSSLPSSVRMIAFTGQYQGIVRGMLAQ
jgi:hypothetical protein